MNSGQGLVGSPTASPKRSESRERPLLVNFRVTNAEREHLHRMAKRHGMSVSNLIRQAIGLPLARIGRGGGDQ